MNAREYFLLPGPTELPAEVQAAGAGPMINHRGPAFKEILSDVSERMKKVFKTSAEVYALTASGTGGLEAAVANFIDRGDRVIVASIGNFGERFQTICQRYGAEVDFIDFGWGNAIDPAVLGAKLRADTEHRIKAVLFQHNETSTGVVNPVAEIGACKGDHPALFIADCVSGLGAAPFAMDRDHIDVAIAGSQKAFMSPPGLAFLAVNQRAMAVAESTQNQRYYFDLRAAKAMYEKGQTPYTPAISVFYSVQKALNYYDEVGVDAVVARHYYCRDLLRAGIRGLGLTLLADDAIASPAVTAVGCPDGVDPQVLRKWLLEKHHIVIAGGQGKHSANSFRIGHLGLVAPMDLLVAVAGLEMALNECGYEVALGRGVAAMQRFLLERTFRF